MDIHGWTHSPCKIESLFLEVIVQSLLDFFQKDVRFLEFVQHICLGGHYQCMAVFNGLSHDVAPVSIHYTKLPPFLWHLGHYIFRGEDGLCIMEVYKTTLGLNREP